MKARKFNLASAFEICIMSYGTLHVEIQSKACKGRFDAEKL